MKKIIFLISSILLIFLSSCDDPGETSLRLDGNESNLPEELKGLKVYSVSTGGGNYIKVAILDGKINSTTYREGKYDRSTIILGEEPNRVIQVNQILMENDSLIICRK